MAAKKASTTNSAAKKPSAMKTPVVAKTSKSAKPKVPVFQLSSSLLGVPVEAAREPPSMPVGVALLEGARLWAAASKARPKFVALEDFPAESFDAIPHLLTALADAEKDWQRLRQVMKLKSLVVVRKDAEAWRRILMVAGRYLLRKNAAAQLELDRIQEGEGLPDLIQDLNDLADFICAHLDVLLRDTKVTRDTPAALRAMAKTLSEGEGDSETALSAMEHRNKVFAALDTALGEVRAAAGYLYANDPKRLQPYRSQYEAARKRNRRNTK